jgi:hypothetical protein
MRQAGLVGGLAIRTRGIEVQIGDQSVDKTILVGTPAARA